MYICIYSVLATQTVLCTFPKPINVARMSAGHILC